jgi:hypothetical protein
MTDVKKKPRMYAPERLGALTDGVFAIALTLLVLDLKLPDPPPVDLTVGEILRADWHPFVGWIISFVVLARLWLALVEGRSPRWSRRALHHLVGVPIVAVVAVLVTFIDPSLALIVWAIESVVVVVLLLTSGRVDESARSTAKGRDPYGSRPVGAC